MKKWLENDRTWGTVLIVLGILSIIFKPFERFDHWIKGGSDNVLTAMLFLVAAGTVAIALYGRPSAKALALVWIVTP